MHRHNYDQTPHKAINLKGLIQREKIDQSIMTVFCLGAKVLYYDDPKFGPSLELTWNTRSNHPKHYHVNNSNQIEKMIEFVFFSYMHQIHKKQNNGQMVFKQRYTVLRTVSQTIEVFI